MVKVVSYLAMGLVVGVMVSACDTPDDQSRVSGQVGVSYRQHLPCSDSVIMHSEAGEGLAIPGGYFIPEESVRILGGAVAIPLGSGEGDVRIGRYHPDPPHPELPYGIKVGLLLRRDAAVEIRVPDRFHDTVAIEYGAADVPAHRIAAGPCYSETEWLVFTGGIWLSEPACIVLEVASGGSTIGTVQLGLGEACPTGYLP